MAAVEKFILDIRLEFDNAEERMKYLKELQRTCEFLQDKFTRLCSRFSECVLCGVPSSHGTLGTGAVPGIPADRCKPAYYGSCLRRQERNEKKEAAQ